MMVLQICTLLEKRCWVSSTNRHCCLPTDAWLWTVRPMCGKSLCTLPVYTTTETVPFSKDCALEPIFKTLQFQAPKMLFSCKHRAKTQQKITFFGWNLCCANRALVPSVFCTLVDVLSPVFRHLCHTFDEKRASVSKPAFLMPVTLWVLCLTTMIQWWKSTLSVFC